jgi:hypothetical protein
MPGLNPNRYPLDLTGTATTNLVSNEAVSLLQKKVRVFAPRNGPFYPDGLIITDTVTGLPLTTTQYKNLYLVAPAAEAAKKEVFALVAILDQTVSNQLACTYQTIGGDFVQSVDSITAMVDALSSDSRPASWDNILDREDVFTPTQHYQSAGSTLGWEYLAMALQTLSMTLLLGDSLKKDFVLRYLDATLLNSNATVEALVGPNSELGQHIAEVNAHNVDKAALGFPNVQNYAIASNQEAMEGIRSDLYVVASSLPAAIQNAVNGGMDAHIGNHTNPHGVTAAQVGLGNVMNYQEAVADDFNSLDAANKRYVTNVSLSLWLTSALSGINATYSSSLATIDQRVTDLGTQATSVVGQAAAATAAANTAAANTQSAVTEAQLAKTQAETNAQAVVGAQSAAQALLSGYVTAAVAAADAAGYSRGYADGRRA